MSGSEFSFAMASIQQRFEETTSTLERFFIELTRELQCIQSHAIQKSRPSGLLSVVPPTKECQSPSLLFTEETRNIFLKTAMSRDLFYRLKKIAKRWLANVKAEERKRITKISNEIAKAAIDGRISHINKDHIGTYRTRITELYCKSLNAQPGLLIPDGEIRKAFSRKICVYLQNSKKKHSKWIDSYRK